ncbi:acyl carrier protein [Nocardioides sp. W3-2-3]|uniref:acyl carrier protein n=1 Tax=Nocardioides convexus TaxID=2712224 RepID=UPI00241814D7|nr:acyl carrier protein [Nocardioides convexus]NHA00378.1 acyl carrier protein [Nocardioides convexus]
METLDRVAALTEIWRQVLGNPGLDETSDIFESGGTSLHVLRITGQIYDTLGVDVPLRQVFTYPTPRGLSAFLDEQRATPGD